jgi:sulfonate transport system ATP-binding protein
MSKWIGAHIVVSGASRRFAAKEVLRDIRLDIPAGQFVAIVGRSGCGKSTLLRLMAGLDTPTEGKLLIDGEDVSGIREDVRMLFQDARLLPWKRTVANVQIGARTRDNEQALQALDQVGLADRAEAWPGILSGGQRQRVSLARALVSSPRLLLLDEPLGALDALTRIDMQRLIESLWERQRFTAILVTHDVSEAVALADRVVLIEEGRIAMDIKITLDRPRERDSSFIYFEKLILDRILDLGDDSSRHKKATYSI